MTASSTPVCRLMRESRRPSHQGGIPGAAKAVDWPVAGAHRRHMNSVGHLPTHRTSDVEGRLWESAVGAMKLAALRPEVARAIGTPVVEPARRIGAWSTVSLAERALGVAAMNLNEIDAAVAHLRAAVAAGVRAGSRARTGEARMSLASALVLRGQGGPATREIDAAVRDLEGVQGARARAQRAAILQELGKEDAALEELRRTLPVLRQAGEVEWAARALSNRSLIHAGRRAFGAAEADLLDARRLCLDHDFDLLAAFAEQNLGCVKAMRGDVPVALQHFDAAQERYRRNGVVQASLLVDRAEVLLSVRLLDEARETVEAAVVAYQQQKRDVHQPEAHLLLSTVALVQGDTGTAIASADAAVRGFRRLGRANSVALARFARLQAQVATEPGGISPERAAHVAGDLESRRLEDSGAGGARPGRPDGPGPGQACLGRAPSVDGQPRQACRPRRRTCPCVVRGGAAPPLRGAQGGRAVGLAGRTAHHRGLPGHPGGDRAPCARQLPARVHRPIGTGDGAREPGSTGRALVGRTGASQCAAAPPRAATGAPGARPRPGGPPVDDGRDRRGPRERRLRRSAGRPSGRARAPHPRSLSDPHG